MSCPAVSVPDWLAGSACMARAIPSGLCFNFPGATGIGFCTDCSPRSRMDCSFAQLFPPLPFPWNCYIDLENSPCMHSSEQKLNNLVLYRRRMGFTQKHVARLLGQRDTSMISHYEHGRSLPPLPVALSLEIILRVPVAFLFPGMYDELKLRIRNQEQELAGVGHQDLFGGPRV